MATTQGTNFVISSMVLNVLLLQAKCIVVQRVRDMRFVTLITHQILLTYWTVGPMTCKPIVSSAHINTFSSCMNPLIRMSQSITFKDRALSRGRHYIIYIGTNACMLDSIAYWMVNSAVVCVSTFQLSPKLICRNDLHLHSLHKKSITVSHIHTWLSGGKFCQNRPGELTCN